KLRQLAELPVSVLRGVGTNAQRELVELGIDSVLDLITHYPRQGRYIDGTRLVPIASLVSGDKASVLGRVTRVGRPSSGYGRGRRRSPAGVELEVADESGRIAVVFFNQVWRAKQLPVGTLALFFGSVGTYRGSRQLNSPTAEVLQSAGRGDETGDRDTGDGDSGRSADTAGERVPSTGRVFPVY